MVYILRSVKSTEYFSGFSAKGHPVFSPNKELAYMWENRDHAKAQALLLGRRTVQLKPIEVGVSSLRKVLGEAIARHAVRS